MFGLFKKDLRSLMAADYDRLAQAAAEITMVHGPVLLFQSPLKNRETLMSVHLELLAFITCLVQFRVQKEFKVSGPDEVGQVICSLIERYSKIVGPTGPDSITKEVWQAVASETSDRSFLLLVSRYAARDHQALGIPENLFETFCRSTNQVTTLVRGSSGPHALIIFQLRSQFWLFPEPEANATEVASHLQLTYRTYKSAVERVAQII